LKRLVPLASLGVVLGLAVVGRADAETTKGAKQAIVIEHPSGRELTAKAADRPMAPSSMTKIMTLFLAFEAMERGKASPETTVTISKRAAEARGASVGLKAGETAAFGDLVRAAAIASANDAAVAIAEHLAGSETAFAKAMTEKAKELGLKGSRFANVTGHHAKDHRMTARDVAQLAARLIEKFPQHYRWFAEPEFRFRGETYRNRNPLLGAVAGADGIKTGQTAAGGYGLAGSAVRNGRRLIVVVNGLASEAARADEAKRLLEDGFRRLAQ
jgi:D-alanyl-D-alanine carboxypeptidase (penicillin-binding protein 5/6)